MRLPGKRTTATVAAATAAAGLAAWLAVAFSTPAAVAGGLTLVGAIVAFVRPPLGLVLIAGLALTVPFFVVPVRVGAQPPVIDVVLVATLAGTARALWRGRRATFPRWFGLAIGTLAAAYLISSAVAWPGREDTEALQYGVKLALAAALPLAALAWARAETLERYAPPLVTTALALQAAVAIALLATGDAGSGFLAALSPGGYPAESIQRFLPDAITPRATGLLVDPNVLGVTLAGGLPFVLAWTFPERRVRLPGLLAIGLIVTALGVSLSRGGWLAAAAGVVVWLALTRPRLALIATLAAAALVLGLPAFEHMRSGLLGRDVAAALRIDEAREAMRVMARFPWVGTGFGASPHPDLFVGVSNAWLWIGERAGLPALGAALVAYLGVVWVVLRRPIRRELARPAGAALIAVLVASMVDHHIVSFPHLAMLVGLLLAVAVSACTVRPLEA